MRPEKVFALTLVLDFPLLSCGAGGSVSAVPAVASPLTGVVIDPHTHVSFDGRSGHPERSTSPEAVEALLRGTDVRAGLMVMATGSPEEAAPRRRPRVSLAVVPGASAVLD